MLAKWKEEGYVITKFSIVGYSLGSSSNVAMLSIRGIGFTICGWIDVCSRNIRDDSAREFYDFCDSAFGNSTYQSWLPA